MSAFPVRQEPETIAWRRVVRIALVGLLIGAISVFCSGLLLFAKDGSIRPSFAEPGGPRVVDRTLGGVEQTPIWAARPGLDSVTLGREELSKWGWADRDGGLATIPLERAIDLVVDEAAR